MNLMHSLHWELQIGFRFSIVAKRFGTQGGEIKVFCQRPTLKHIDKVGLLSCPPLGCSAKTVDNLPQQVKLCRNIQDLMPIRIDPQLFLPILQHFIAFPGLCTRAPYLGGEEGWICFPQPPPHPPTTPILHLHPNPTRAKMDVCPFPNRCYHPPPQ